MKLDLQLFGGRGGSSGLSGGAGANVNEPLVSLSEERKDELRAEFKAARSEALEFARSHMEEDGSMSMRDAEQYARLMAKRDEIEYELQSALTPAVTGDRWKGADRTELSPEEAAVARRDLIKDKQTYMAVKSAEHGVAFEEGGRTLNTAVDDLYERNPQKVYNQFSGTRKMLQKKYGDEVTLYRAGTSQTKKATTNMTTSKANAEQYAKEYGSKVTAIKVPTKDILCVNVTRNGAYEEVLVLNNRKRS